MSGTTPIPLQSGEVHVRVSECERHGKVLFGSFA
jgi:hypothetical protein